MQKTKKPIPTRARPPRKVAAAQVDHCPAESNGNGYRNVQPVAKPPMTTATTTATAPTTIET